MKNLKNLKGANELSKNEQKLINGGKKEFPSNPFCGSPRGTGGSENPCNGNPGCPAGEGCFIELSGDAFCHCL